MSRVLILDDDLLFCKTLRDGILLTRELGVSDVDITNSVDKARLRMIRAVETNSPYDLFLIDQYLGLGLDGIQVMGDLRRISPSTDAIVFTGMGDSGSGQRAYASGAARYLQKPFDIDELISIMQSLKEWRRVLHERTWMQALIEITEETEKLQIFEEVASAIVEGALRLGFERAFLFWVPVRQQADALQMVGIHIAGKNLIPEFAGMHFSVNDSPYAAAAHESRDVLFFQRRALGVDVMETCFGVERFSPPVGEWACLPLWSSERFSGVLVLDNAERDATLSDDQRKLLQLYARQVAAILERARLFGRETRNRQEIQLINQIGKQITVYVNDLDRLLEEIRSQIGRRYHVENFFVALINDESQRLDFRLHYEEGKHRARHGRKLNSGLVGYMVQNQLRGPLYLRSGNEDYCHEHGIKAIGKAAKCWVGIPLWVVNRMIGVMVVQHYSQDGFYSPEDVDLLSAVADQIAGAIFVALIVERERERLNLLQQASAELVSLINEDESWMWRALLNILSASYGLKFNRVWLFLAEADHTRLSGLLGVGQNDTLEAKKVWEHDMLHDMTFTKFISLLRDGKLPATPFETLTSAMIFNAPEEWEDVLFRVLRTGKRTRLNANESALLLPSAFVQAFAPGECAVVPMRAGASLIGLVIVDNKHNGEPIEEDTLDRMETFLSMAGLVYVNERRRAQQQALLAATHAVAGQNEKVSLGDTLQQVCKAARMVNNADWVTIYPIKDSGSDEFDGKNVGRDGDLLNSSKPIKEKPRQRGMAAFILRGARLVINDVNSDARLIDGQRIAEHRFIQREEIRSFIGMPVLDQITAIPMGVIYLNYRKPQRFTNDDIQRAETFANLASIAIRNARSAALGQSSQRELNILQKVLKAALSNPDEQVVIHTLLNVMHEMLLSERVTCRVILAGWETRLEGQPPELVLKPFTDGPGAQVIEDDLTGADHDRVRKALDSGMLYLCEDHARVIVPIKTGARSLGVLDVFDPEEEISTKRQRTLERVAAIAALALDNARRQMNLVSALKSVRAFTAPSSLSDTLRAIVEEIRMVSPDISALTVWYTDSRTNTVKLGQAYGVIYREQMLPNRQAEGSVMAAVLESREPIWAEDAFKDPRLINQFVYREAIRSVVAFPLRAEDKTVGVMFFNYRHEHHFSQEERSLFPLLAEIVAASIQDALLLEEKQRESARLEATLSITDAIGASLNLSQVIDKALEKLHEILHYLNTSACLLLYRSNEHVLEFAPESFKFFPIDVPEERDVRFLNMDSRGIVTRVARQTLRQRHAIFENVDNVEDDPDYRRVIHGTRSELCVSLISGDKLLGVLALESPMRSAFEEEETRLVQGIAQQISLAIERSQQISLLQFKDTVATATAWASEIAHDINREVGKIRDQVYWIREGISEPDKIRLYLEKIVESATKLTSVGPLGNMADKPFYVDSDLQEWAVSLMQTGGGVSGGRGIQVCFEFNCPDVAIATNTIGLQRVLRHLVRNAIQSMKGKGVLTIRTQVAEQVNCLEIQIQDSGPGIDESVRTRLFQQPVTTKGERGGFGLLIARQIVEEMGGVIWPMPQVAGRGAVFCIRLPLIRADTEPAGSQPSGQGLEQNRSAA